MDGLIESKKRAAEAAARIKADLTSFIESSYLDLMQSFEINYCFLVTGLWNSVSIIICSASSLSITKSQSGRNQISVKVLKRECLFVVVKITPLGCPGDTPSDRNHNPSVGLMIVERSTPTGAQDAIPQTEADVAKDSEFQAEISKMAAQCRENGRWSIVEE